MSAAPQQAEDGAETQKMDPAYARRDFYRLAVDWIYLRKHLPTPPQQISGRRTARREYGHPAEWASDKSALITSLFQSWHSLVADHRGETPPPAGASEARRIVAAWKYLEPRMEQLCELVTKDDLAEINELHQKIRHALQLDRRPVMWLNIECPICDHRAVFRNIEGERLTCGNCGWTDIDEHKNFHVFRTLVNVVERLEPFLP